MLNLDKETFFRPIKSLDNLRAGYIDRSTNHVIHPIVVDWSPIRTLTEVFNTLLTADMSLNYIVVDESEQEMIHVSDDEVSIQGVEDIVEMNSPIP